MQGGSENAPNDDGRALWNYENGHLELPDKEQREIVDGQIEGI
jgi:hypothetical protein